MLFTSLFCMDLPPKRQQDWQISRLEAQVSGARFGGWKQLQG